MFRKLANMFHFAKPIASNPDTIATQIIAATQRNENAGERTREVIRELLAANDGAKKGSR